MATLSKAIREERWQVAAYCILLALVNAVEQVPQEAVPALLETLAGEKHDLS
ncbi:MAG: hypothetical protein HYY00_07260 [Chloroflexi bacterium]|nr:hypothetical protein [Chloroflexota bacterium]